MASEVNTAEDRQPRKKPNLLFRFLIFLLTAALVLGAVFLVVNWEKVNFDFVRRWFTYRTLTRTETGQVESFSYNGGVNSSFAEVNGDLLVCSSTGVRLYSASGAAYVDQPCVLQNPILVTGGGAALVYDAGGTDLFVYRDREEVFSLSGSGKTILSASLNAQGLLTVVAKATNAKGMVTAYNSSFQPLIDVSISSRFVTDALLSPDGKTLAVATAGQTAGIYDSQIAFYSLNRGSESSDPDGLCSLGNNTILALNWTTSPLRVVAENSLFLLNSDGFVAGEYSYDYRYLKGFSLEGEDYCTLLLGKYRAGADADLVMVDAAGEAVASLPMEGQVLSLSAAGRYLSVLTADGLTVYTGAMEPYDTLNDLQGARKVLQKADGSVLLIARETAQLYLPG